MFLRNHAGCYGGAFLLISTDSEGFTLTLTSLSLSFPVFKVPTGPLIINNSSFALQYTSLPLHASTPLDSCEIKKKVEEKKKRADEKKRKREESERRREEEKQKREESEEERIRNLEREVNETKRLIEMCTPIQSLSHFNLYFSDPSKLTMQDNRVTHVGNISYETCVFKEILETVCIFTRYRLLPLFLF